MVRICKMQWACGASKVPNNVKKEYPVSTLPVLSQYSLCEVCDCPAEGCDRAMCVQEMSVVTRPGTSYISQDNSGGITRRESNMSTDMKIVSMRVSSPAAKIMTTTRTRLSYYNVTTRLVDLVGLCWFKQNLAGKIC